MPLDSLLLQQRPVQGKMQHGSELTGGQRLERCHLRFSGDVCPSKQVPRVDDHPSDGLRTAREGAVVGLWSW